MPRNYKPKRPVLSVLITALPERGELLGGLVDGLIEQIGDGPVEVLCLIDNRKRSTGSKRNALLGVAAGKWTTFIDDDDLVSNDYVDTLLAEIKKAGNAKDVITFHSVLVKAGAVVERHEFSLTNCKLGTGAKSVDEAGVPVSLRIVPIHMCWRRSVAMKVPFVDSCHGEDWVWAAEMVEVVGPSRQVNLDKSMYFYMQDELKAV